MLLFLLQAVEEMQAKLEEMSHALALSKDKEKVGNACNKVLV